MDLSEIDLNSSFRHPWETERVKFIEYLLKNLEYPEKKSLGSCRSCCMSYATKYNSKRRQKKMAMKNNWYDRTSKGKIYVIGVDEKNPLKIGICTGSTIDKRMAALQTSHWLELKILYESPIINDPRGIEKRLHTLYKDKKVKGEWFDIRYSELENIKLIVEQLEPS
jgi:hypothetical protein